MADKAINQLPEATQVDNADLFVLEQTGVAKKLTGQTLVADLATALDGHGGISDITYADPVAPSLDGTMTITMADATVYTLTVSNGNGISSVNVRYGISASGTNPALVQSWNVSVVAPTNQYPYMWTRITFTYTNGNTTVAYSVTAKAEDPSVTIGSVTASPGQSAGATVTNSGTALDPILNFAFTLPQGNKGDTGDYIDPIVSFGTSTAAATEPTTWYSSPSSISYTAGNFIWQKTEYTLHDAGTIQSTEKKIIGYIGQNGSGSGTVQQITFNGTVYTDDGTGNVPMTVDAEDVGAIEDPSTKADGQVLTYDSAADAWVAANPSTGNVNTVDSIGVAAGTTNIVLGAVRYTASQTLTSAQKAQARANIGAVPAHIGASAPTEADAILWVDTDDTSMPAVVANALPAGGTAGQALVKNSGTDYDVGWASLWTETSLGNNCYLLKCGNAYSLRIASVGAVTNSSGVICTLPNEAIPSYAPWVCGAVTVGQVQTNSSFQWIQIETNGTVTVRNLASGQTTGAGYYAFGGACGIWTV